MSTIASPRETSTTGRRIPLLSTPTTSTRPSLDLPHPPSSTSSPLAPPKRSRAALREYYNLKTSSSTQNNTTNTETNSDNAPSETSSIHDFSFSDVQESEMDREGFEGEKFVRNVLEEKSLGDVLRIYNGVLMDIRSLDAEKKALVYDNYSKLIAATETIRKMRAGMDPLNPMARTLDPAIAGIYERAEGVRREWRGSLSEREKKMYEMSTEEKESLKRKERVRGVVNMVLDTPEKVRGLVKEGKMDEARVVWESIKRVLERWRERGVGGSDVEDCIEDGEAALRGEEPTVKSWVNLKGGGES